MSNPQIEQRISELLKSRQRRCLHPFNCHGASMYVLGVTRKTRIIDFSAFTRMLNELKRGVRSVKLKQIRWEDNRAGDLVVLGGYMHSGIVVKSARLNPTIFSKYGFAESGTEHLSSLVRFYHDHEGVPYTADFFRAK